jgi:hypothetical protein
MTPTIVKQKNMAMGPTRPGIKNDFAGEGHQQYNRKRGKLSFYLVYSWKLEVIHTDLHYHKHKDRMLQHFIHETYKHGSEFLICKFRVWCKFLVQQGYL